MTADLKKSNEPVWDKLNSTYMRIIYLQNGYTLTGYSKKVGRNERRDKTDLLTNWILRDLKNGYLDAATTNPKITPLDRIEYYLKRNDTYEPIVNLYYNFPEWVSTKWMENKKLLSFITRLYTMIRHRADTTSIVNALEVRTRAPAGDPLDISHPRFTSITDLNAYVHLLTTKGDLPSEAIDDFYKKYKAKYFNELQRSKSNPN